MDAKSKANFINSISTGNEVVCQNCGVKNEIFSEFCITCGTEISTNEDLTQKSVYPLDNDNSIPALKQANIKYVEPSNAFAHGLPDWTIEPPQLLVRRR